MKVNIHQNQEIWFINGDEVLEYVLSYDERAIDEVNTIRNNESFVNRFNVDKAGVSQVAPSTSSTSTVTPSTRLIPNTDSNVSFKQGGKLKIKLK